MKHTLQEGQALSTQTGITGRRRAGTTVAGLTLALTAALIGSLNSRAQTGAQALSGDLTFAVWGNEQDVGTLKSVAAAFQKKNPKVSIKIILSDCGPSYAECKKLIAGGSMPDVIVPGIWNYNSMVDDAVLANLEPYIKHDGLNVKDFAPSVLKAVRSLKDKNLYGLPMGFNVQSLYYNKTLFDQAKLAYPPANGNYTWDDLRKWARALTLDANGNKPGSAAFNPARIKQWGYTTEAVNGQAAHLDALLFAFGGSLMKLPSRQTCNIESPATVRGLQFLQDMVWKDHSVVSRNDFTETPGYLRFRQGQVAMQMASHEQVGGLRSDSPDLRYDMAALPKGIAGNATAIQIHIWAMYNKSPKKDLAWQFIKWAATDGAVSGAADRLVPIMNLQPVYKDLASGVAFAKAAGEPSGVVAAQVTPAGWPRTTVPSAFNAKTDDILGQDGLAPVLTDIMLNKKTAAAAVSGACAKINTVMGR